MRNGVLASKVMDLEERSCTPEDKQAINYLNSALDSMSREENVVALDYLRRAKAYIQIKSGEELINSSQDSNDPYIKTRVAISYLRDGLYSHALEELKIAETCLIDEVASRMNLPPLVW